MFGAPEVPWGPQAFAGWLSLMYCWLALKLLSTTCHTVVLAIGVPGLGWILLCSSMIWTPLPSQHQIEGGIRDCHPPLLSSKKGGWGMGAFSPKLAKSMISDPPPLLGSKRQGGKELCETTYPGRTDGLLFSGAPKQLNPELIVLEDPK